MGIMPYGGSSTGWGNPLIILGLIVGLGLLALFVYVESRVREPLFNLDLFRIRSFAAGCAAQLLNALAYGGLQFVLIVWLQGIWLPLHGYSFESTPLWSAIYMIPLLAGFMIFGAAGGKLSDRFGARGLCALGMVGVAIGFMLLSLFPANFEYLPFAVVLFLIGSAFGIFAAPNTAAIMNALPKNARGVGSGMRATFQNAGSPLSLTIFFSIMWWCFRARCRPRSRVAWLSRVCRRRPQLPPQMCRRLARCLRLSWASTLWKAWYRRRCWVRSHQPRASRSWGPASSPNVISAPFTLALRDIFWLSAGLALLAALCSYLRGESFIYEEQAPLSATSPAVEAAVAKAQA